MDDARGDPHDFSTSAGAFGQSALDAFSARLVVLFLGIAALAVPFTSVAGRGWWAPVTVVGLLAGLGLVMILLRRQAGAGVLVAVGSVLAGLTAAGAGAVPATEVHQVTNWLLAGLAGGVAVSRGPVRGALVLVAAAASAFTVESALHGPASVLTFLGPMSYCLGGAGTHLAARHGFRMTEQAMVTSARTAADLQIAEQRWRAAKLDAMRMHDTVLSTLSVLALGGAGPAEDQVRERCRRDVAALTCGPAHPGSVAPEHEPAGESGPGSVADVVLAAVDTAGRSGLSCRVHGLPAGAGSRLEPRTAQALADVLTECLSNVRRHSGVRSADVVLAFTHDTVTVGVTDQGAGFVPAEVPPDRLGLRLSVRRRIEDVGGRVSIWSSAGVGTTVLLAVPIGAAVDR